MLNPEETVCTNENPGPEFSGADSRWGSIHVFYDTNQDNLILECLAPLAEWLVQSRQISQIFFIRHWQGGPHVRFRFRLAKEREQNNILCYVQGRIAEYLAQQPSPSVISEDVYRKVAAAFAEREGTGADIWPRHPNNSMIVSQYFPEWNKYGGAEGMRTAERFFEGSTFLAFQMLSKFQHSREKRLGTGFVMAISAAYAFGLASNDAASFFHSYSQLWMATQFEAAQESWRSQWEKSRAKLHSAASSILASRNDGSAETSPTWLHRWEALLSSCGRELAANGTLPVPLEQIARSHRSKWWFYLAQYIHTHNNRLGLLPADEGYLGFIASETLRNILPKFAPGGTVAAEAERR